MIDTKLIPGRIPGDLMRWTLCDNLANRVGENDIYPIGSSAIHLCERNGWFCVLLFLSISDHREARK